MKLKCVATNFIFLTLQLYLTEIYGILKSAIYVKNPWFTQYPTKSYYPFGKEIGVSW